MALDPLTPQGEGRKQALIDQGWSPENADKEIRLTSGYTTKSTEQFVGGNYGGLEAPDDYSYSEFNPSGSTTGMPKYDPITYEGELLDPYKIDRAQYVPTLDTEIGQAFLNPAFVGQLDSGNLQGLDYENLEGYDAYSELATGDPGDSAWAKAATEQAGLHRQNTMDAATRQAAGAEAQGFSNAASRGGIGTGAQGRLTSDLSRELMRSKQGAYRAEGGQQVEIAKQAALMQQDALKDFTKLESTLAGRNVDIANLQSTRDADAYNTRMMENVRIGNQANLYDTSTTNANLQKEIELRNLNKTNLSNIQMSDAQYNIENVLNDKSLGDKWNMDLYKLELAKKAAHEQSQATIAAGGTGGGSGIGGAAKKGLDFFNIGF